jgi:hypothetical protein
MESLRCISFGPLYAARSDQIQILFDLHLVFPTQDLRKSLVRIISSPTDSKSSRTVSSILPNGPGSSHIINCQTSSSPSSSRRFPIVISDCCNLHGPWLPALESRLTLSLSLTTSSPSMHWVSHPLFVLRIFYLEPCSCHLAIGIKSLVQKHELWLFPHPNQFTLGLFVAPEQLLGQRTGELTMKVTRYVTSVLL